NGLFAQSGEVRDLSQTEPVPYSGKEVFTLTHATDCGYDASVFPRQNWNERIFNRRLSVHRPGLKAAIILSFALLPLPVLAQSIRVSYVGTTGTNLPLWVAQEASLFKKYGLTTDLILISGGSTMI